MMTCTHCKKPIARGQKYHRTKRGPHHADCMASFARPPCSAPNAILTKEQHDELTRLCLLKAVKERDEIAEALRMLILRAEYVCAHRYGRNDPVGTRLIAIEDLRAELKRARAALNSQAQAQRPGE